MSEKLLLKNLFNQTSVYISQDHMSQYSHYGTGAVDYVPQAGTESPIYAPCNLKVKYTPTINTTNSLENTNTIMFESTEAVEFADGTTAILAISLAHMSDVKYTSMNCASWTTSTTFNKGDVIYYTGSKGGGSTGIHVHVRLAKGTFISPWTHVNSYTVLNTTGTTPMQSDDTFYADDMTITYNSNSSYASASNFNWKFTTPDSEGDGEDGGNDELTGVYLCATRQAFRVRTSPVNGSIITTITTGNSVPIIEFLGKQSDNYQWVKVNYNGTEGYSQLDTYNCYTVSGSPSLILYLDATYYAYRVRTSPVNGSIITTIAVSGRLPITGFLNIQSDNYQWVKVNYNGVEGYSQLDTYNCYTIVTQ